MHAGMHAIRGRKDRKSDFRQLWQMRVGAAAREQGLSYSKFIAALKKQNIALNRKMLAELAATRPEIFEKIVQSIKT